MKVSDFDFELPKDLIAQTPVSPRNHSRLMIVDRKSKEIKHDYFFNINKYVSQDDLFVFNNTKVIPARLIGNKETGGRIEILLLKHLRETDEWEVLGRNIGRAQKVFFSKQLFARVVEVNKIKFNLDYLNLLSEIEKIGITPLPPYIGKNGVVDDVDIKNKYQTVYAKEPGSAAAPTAGLHFTEEMMKEIANKAYVTLNVGLGTFQPLKNEIVEENKLHEELYSIEGEQVEKITRFKARKSIVAVGTTTVRVLESYASNRQLSGETNIFIFPGYQFQMVDKLVTNFHLPKSSLLMLVCAFGGTDLILRAYKEAIVEKYRFFSFGDAMLVI